jgi:heptosyltransferase-2
MRGGAVADERRSPTLNPRRILVRGVNWVGDAVMTTPALQRLRERFPEAHLTLLTHAKLAALWPHHPSIDSIVTFAQGESPWQVARRLAQQSFDLALVLPNSPRSALEVWLARIPWRVGYAAPWRNWWLSHRISRRPEHCPMRKLSGGEVRKRIQTRQADAPRAAQANCEMPAHHTQEYLHLVAALGASSEPLPTRLIVTAEETAAVAKKFNLPIDSAGCGPILGLNPGAEYGPAKRWPAERFAAAAGQIAQSTSCVWLILGSPADVVGASQIEQAIREQPRVQSRPPHPAGAQRGNPILNLAGKTSLRELCALLKLCRVVLTNDTGPMHLAAALEIPVVVPFGSTSPALTAPGLPGDTRHRLLRSDAPCSPCFRRTCPIDFRCMTGIPVERVVDAVLAALLSK